MDYQGNSNKDKEKQEKPAKVVAKVVVGEVIIPKKSLWRKFRETFLERDFKDTATYVISEVLLPAAKNMIVDTVSEGISNMMYGNSTRSYRRGLGTRITYNRSVNRGYSPTSPISRSAPALEPGPRRASLLRRDDFILSSRAEADLVLERMIDIIDNYEVVSVADLNELIGLPISPVDPTWGWTDLGDARVRQVRDGYLIELPQSESIS